MRGALPTDTTKLKLILNGPTIPLAVSEDFFKSPDLFSIETFKTGIYNALEASEIVQEQSKLLGSDKPSTLKNKTSNSRAIKSTSAPKKTRTKKAQQSKTEG